MKFPKLFVSVLAMVFMIAGQANAQCLVGYDSNGSGDLTILCGPSDDVITVFVKDDADVPSVFVDIGDGAGPVNQGPAADLTEVLIETGDGSDDVSIFDLVASFALQVTTGRGPDKVSVGPEVQVDELLAIDTGAGDDTIALGLNVSAKIDVEVRARSGSDSVSTYAAPGLDFQGVVADTIVISGGAGISDTIAIGPESLFGTVRIVGFGVVN